MASRELDAAAVFTPAVVLPCQLPTAVHLWPGERKLALAVLEEALTTLFRAIRVVSETAKWQREEALRWINANDSHWPFSDEMGENE